VAYSAASFEALIIMTKETVFLARCQQVFCVCTIFPIQAYSGQSAANIGLWLVQTNEIMRMHNRLEFVNWEEPFATARRRERAKDCSTRCQRAKAAVLEKLVDQGDFSDLSP